ncbi:MAG TPA: 2-amino-4-hydroxy-6-hydroxymethyldihydropteridine diphosphokinase [Steroidobacteraceae bacterium]|jgi:2-amino-4-hydroxy-6-hydroxymethyldihydropteridine diphosphokinase|nr:2-amino-4-hydroxy-6-hydroxymethyldihydropteridine diphosphokinase [Steroidobacteraceae bacterium]
MIWQPVYIGVGSNVDDPAAQVRLAVAELGALPATRVVCVSPLYGSRPLGSIAQPDFVNAAVGGLTQLDSRKLLAELQGLERRLGRPALHQKWGPRVIDLDLLVYGRECSYGGNLALPHPGIAERNFVLRPLADIAPDLDVPGVGRVAELVARASAADIWPL